MKWSRLLETLFTKLKTKKQKKNINIKNNNDQDKCFFFIDHI